jgi:hypothetical protein
VEEGSRGEGVQPVRYGFVSAFEGLVPDIASDSQIRQIGSMGIVARYESGFFADPTGAAVFSAVLAILAVLTSVARGRPSTGCHRSLRHDDGEYRPNECHLPEPSLG